MRFFATFALTVSISEFNVVSSADCKTWCDQIPIPAVDPVGGLQSCDFANLCDSCAACGDTGDSDVYLTICGSTAGACKNNPFKEEAKDTIHEVRCCSDVALPNWQKKKTSCPWASSLKPNCVHGETYDGAVQACTSAGGRLCTAGEIRNDCTKGTGCNHDSDHVWSSTPPLKKTIVCGKFGRCGAMNSKSSYDFLKHEVRCCSDTPQGGTWKKNSGCDVWGESDIPTCFHAETYQKATEICEGLNARICTKKELEDNCTAGTGCNHDNDHVWSRDDWN